MNKHQARDGALHAFQKPGDTAPKPVRVERLEERMSKMNGRVDSSLHKIERQLERFTDETEHRLRKLERQLGSAWELIDRLVDELVRIEKLEQHLEQAGDAGEVQYRLEQLEDFVAEERKSQTHDFTE